MAAETQKLLGHLLRLTDQATADAALLARWAERKDEDAFAALVARHGPMVLGVCQRVLGDRQHAEDAFQATFLVLARKAATLKRPEALPGYLYGIALRLARKARRSRRYRTLAVSAEHLERTDPRSRGLDALSARELLALVDKEVARLPEVYRLPVLLCVLQERPVDEAARILGWSTGSVRGRLARGRQLLRQRLAKRGLSSSAGALMLFAPGRVPEHLVAASLRNLAGAAPTVKALAAAADLAMGFKIFCLVLVLGAVGIGGGLPLLRAPQPKAPLRAITVALAKEKSHQDIFGDPLPEEAIARLGTIRLRHGEVPWALDFSPDGRSLATAGIDGVVHIWATGTGKETLRIENKAFPELGGGSITSLCFAPDGKTLADARLNQQACVWDVATGKEIRQFGGASHRAGWVVFSPDGKMLAYGGGRDARDFNGRDLSVRLADINSGKDLHQFAGHKGTVTRVAFSPDGTLLASADDEAVHLLEIATGQARTLLRRDAGGPRISALAFSPDGKALAAASAAGKAILLIEPATGKVLQTMKLTGKKEDVKPIVFTPDGKTLISGHKDGFVRFWDTASGKMTHRFRAHKYSVVAMALTRDGRTLATSCNSPFGISDNAVRLWETATAKPLVRYPGPQQEIIHLAVSPDSRRVATSSSEGEINLWEAGSGKLLRHWELGTWRLAFHPDGQTLICGGWTDGRVHLLDAATGKETRQLPCHAGGIRVVTVTRDGKTLATAGYDGFLRLWDLPTGRPLRDLGGKQKGYVFSVDFSPDGKLLVSSHTDKKIRLWETATGKLLREDAEPEYVQSLAFSPDGAAVVSTSGTRDNKPMIVIRDVGTGQITRQPVEWKYFFLDTMALSPDGRMLAWGGQHRKDVYFWEIATGQIIRTLPGHQGRVTCMAFSPNGRLLATGRADASVLIWDMTGRYKRTPPANLDVPALNQLWTELASKDAATAYQARCTLKAAPEQAVPLLMEHLKPVLPADPKRIADAMHGLDSDRFTVRDQAANELKQFGEAAEPALRQVLAANPSEEVRRRVEKLLDSLQGPEQWRRARALEVLEHIATPEGRRVLTALAQGSPQARLTREAQACLHRLNR